MLYPSLTSTDKDKINFNIDQINKYEIDTICLFLTCLEKEERALLFARLKKSTIKKIPFVHLRSDMDEFEVQFLIDNFDTKVFNIHSLKLHPLKFDLSKFKDKIYVENSGGEFDEESVNKFAGVCIDFSHVEQNKRTNEGIYNKLISQIEKFTCGCGHVSAIKKNLVFDKNINKFHFDYHLMDNVTEIEYLFKYKKYYPEFLALELENTIKEQLEIIKYFNSKND